MSAAAAEQHTRHCWLEIPASRLEDEPAPTAPSGRKANSNATRCQQCDTRLLLPGGPRLVLGDGTQPVPAVTLVGPPVLLLHCHDCGWVNVWAVDHTQPSQRRRAEAVAARFNKGWRDQRHLRKTS